MRVPLNWLNDFVDVEDQDPEKLSVKMTLGLCEVEGVESDSLPFTNVLVGKILEISPHPDAEKLQLARVNVGGDELQIVCGATNIVAGQTVPVAVVGAKLPTDKPGETFKIKKSKIRGVTSQGMLCSERELGLGADHEGILQLEDKWLAGTPFESIMESSAVLIIDNKSLTHRSDCWGLHGLGREVAAILNKDFKDFSEGELATFEDLPSLEVNNQAPEACPRYHALKITGLEVKASPEKWVKRLESAGLRSINNIVDATNITLLETAQPLHAFDQRQIVDEKIIVRFAKAGETMTTLDGQERQLGEKELLICDSERPLALAGIMGGENSAVSDDTTEVILEAANFVPGLIRQSSMTLGLRSDSSARFEKGLSPTLVELGLRRCVALLQQSCPAAKVVSGLSAWEVAAPRYINLSTEHVRVRLGQDLSDEEIQKHLSSIGMGCENNKGDLKVTIPHWRTVKDLSQSCDLIEEVGRLHGYDNLKNILPVGPSMPAEMTSERLFERRIRRILSEQSGAYEVLNYSFATEQHRNWLASTDQEYLELKNAIQEDRPYMRQSLIGGLIENLFLNHREKENFRIFEIGRVNFPKEDEFYPSEEKRRVAGLSREGESSFYGAKSMMESIFESWGLSRISWRRPEKIPNWAHPGRVAEAALSYGKMPKVLGLLGELHPKILKEDAVLGRAALWELDLTELLKLKIPAKKFSELPRYPAVLRDIAIVVDERVSLEEVTSQLKKGRKLLVNLEVFDIYRGKGLSEDKKSFAFHLHWQDPNKTLKDQDIEKEMDRLIEDLNKKGWERR